MVWFTHTEHHCGAFQNSQLDDQNARSGSPLSWNIIIIYTYRSILYCFNLKQNYAVQTSYSEFYLSQLIQCLILTIMRTRFGNTLVSPTLIMTRYHTRGVIVFENHSMYHLPRICHTHVPKIRVCPDMIHVFQYINMLTCEIVKTARTRATCCLSCNDDR